MCLIKHAFFMGIPLNIKIKQFAPLASKFFLYEVHINSQRMLVQEERCTLLFS